VLEGSIDSCHRCLSLSPVFPIQDDCQREWLKVKKTDGRMEAEILSFSLLLVAYYTFVGTREELVLSTKAAIIPLLCLNIFHS
jgi:hypothetical protein